MAHAFSTASSWPQTMQAEIAAEVAAFVRETGVRPGLAAVLVGDNPASQVYVRNKRKACEKVGMASWLHELPADTTQAELLDLIAQLNADPQVHGILVQLPLPKQIDEAAIIQAVDAAQGRGRLRPGEPRPARPPATPRFLPCTPLRRPAAPGPQRHPDRRASTSSSSAAATSSASRWR